MTKKNVKLALALVASMATVQATTVQTASAERDFGAIYMQCGLGGMIGSALAPDMGLVAISTNVTWDLGTTAVLSNATAPEMCKGTASKVATLIHDSYTPLEQELAQGQGEYLDALLAVSECDAASDQVVSSVREGFAAEVALPGYASKTQYEKSEALFNLFQAKAGQCSANS